MGRCLAGDPDAWEALVRTHERYVAAILRRGYGLADHEAQDAFQEVFTRVYERLGTLQNPGALRSWIGRTAAHAAVDQIRRRRETPISDLPDLPDPDDVLAGLELALAVHAELAELPADAREIIERFYLRDESYRTIAAAMGIAEGTVASRLSRALERLREGAAPLALAA